MTIAEPKGQQNVCGGATHAQQTGTQQNFVVKWNGTCPVLK